MMRFISKYLLMLLLLLSTVKGYGQLKSYYVDKFTNTNGLPQNSVKNILFDRAGYCWLATYGGLVRYDGRNFKWYTSKNLKGLTTDFIKHGAYDAMGNLYFQSNSGTIFIIRDEVKARASYPELSNDKQLWLPLKGGLASHNYKLRTWTDSIYQKESEIWLSNSGISTPNGNTYVYTGKKINYVNNGNLQQIFQFSPPIEDVKELITGDYFTVILPGNKIFTWKNGLLSEELNRIGGPVNNNPDYLKGNFKIVMQSHKSYLYAGKTLYKIELIDGELTTRIVLENIDVPAISSIYFDSKNNFYYLGSLVSGLFVVKPAYFSFSAEVPDQMEFGFYAQNLIKDKGILCQNILFENDGSYSKLNFTRYTGYSPIIKDGRLYYGDDLIIHLFDFQENQEIGEIKVEKKLICIKADALDTSVINVFTTKNYNRIYHNKIIYSKNIPIPEKDEVLYSEQIGKNEFLIGTTKELIWYNSEKNKATARVKLDAGVRHIYAENKNRIWISVEGKGLYLCMYNKLYHIPSGTNESLQLIHAIIDDQRGFLWLPTNNGLFKVDKKDILNSATTKSSIPYYYCYTVADRLKTNEFNGHCLPNYIWKQDSSLSLPSLFGLVYFDPHQMITTLPEHHIHIGEVALGDSILTFRQGKLISLSQDFSKIIFSVRSPYFGNRINMTMSYTVEGLGIGWLPVPDNGKIIINRIPYGKYKLVIKKNGGFGKLNDEILEIPIEVRPAFYNTTWFYILAFIAICLLTCSVVLIRTKILKTYNQRLQSTIDIQTKDLNTTVRQLADSEKKLLASNQMKDRVTMMVLHDLRSPIRFMHLMINQLVKKPPVTEAEKPDIRLINLRTASSALNDFTEQFFAWAASQHADFKIDPMLVELDEIFEEIRELYSEITSVNGNVFDVHFSGIELYSDKNIISVVIRNIVDNANKITSRGTITLSAQENDGIIRIFIRDTGPGFKREEVESFLEKNSASSTGGHGSLIISNLLEKIGGQLTIETQVDQGSTFIISLNYYAPDHEVPPV